MRASWLDTDRVTSREWRWRNTEVTCCSGESSGQVTRHTRSGRHCSVQHGSSATTTQCWPSCTAHRCLTESLSSSTTSNEYTKRFFLLLTVLYCCFIFRPINTKTYYLGVVIVCCRPIISLILCLRECACLSWLPYGDYKGVHMVKVSAYCVVVLQSLRFFCGVDLLNANHQLTVPQHWLCTCNCNHPTMTFITLTRSAGWPFSQCSNLHTTLSKTLLLFQLLTRRVH